jgi:hypothetical protein
MKTKLKTIDFSKTAHCTNETAHGIHKMQISLGSVRNSFRFGEYLIKCTNYVVYIHLL